VPNTSHFGNQRATHAWLNHFWITRTATDTSARQSIGFRSHESTTARVTLRSIRINPWAEGKSKGRRKTEKRRGEKKEKKNGDI